MIQTELSGDIHVNTSKYRMLTWRKCIRSWARQGQADAVTAMVEVWTQAVLGRGCCRMRASAAEGRLGAFVITTSLFLCTDLFPATREPLKRSNNT